MRQARRPPHPRGGGLHVPGPRAGRSVARRGEGPARRVERRAGGRHGGGRAALREAAEAPARTSRPRRPASPTRGSARGGSRRRPRPSPPCWRAGRTTWRRWSARAPWPSAGATWTPPWASTGARRPSPRTTPSCGGGSRRSSCRPPSGGWGWPRPRWSGGTRRRRCASTRGPWRRRPRWRASASPSPTCSRPGATSRGRSRCSRPTRRATGRSASGARRCSWDSRSSAGPRRSTGASWRRRTPPTRPRARGRGRRARGWSCSPCPRSTARSRRRPGSRGRTWRPSSRCGCTACSAWARESHASRWTSARPGRGSRSPASSPSGSWTSTPTTPSSPARWCAGWTWPARPRACSTGWAGPGRPAPPPATCPLRTSTTRRSRACSGRGSWASRPSGGFEPWRPVSGQEAIEVVDGLSRLGGS